VLVAPDERHAMLGPQLLWPRKSTVESYVTC
jgi:hypothetical protein